MSIGESKSIRSYDAIPTSPFCLIQGNIRASQQSVDRVAWLPLGNAKAACDPATFAWQEMATVDGALQIFCNLHRVGEFAVFEQTKFFATKSASKTRKSGSETAK